MLAQGWDLVPLKLGKTSQSPTFVGLKDHPSARRLNGTWVGLLLKELLSPSSCDPKEQPLIWGHLGTSHFDHEDAAVMAQGWELVPLRPLKLGKISHSPTFVGLKVHPSARRLNGTWVGLLLKELLRRAVS